MLNYTCQKATVIQDLTNEYHIRDNIHQLLFCELQFCDEHGNQFAPVQGVVVIENQNADLLHYAINALREPVSAMSELALDVLCDGAPRWEVSNPEELHTMLVG